MPDAIQILIADLKEAKYSASQQNIIAPVDDFVAALNEIETAIGGGIIPGTIVLTNTHILVGNALNVGADVAMSGDATIANTGLITVTKSGGVAFGSAAFAATSAFDAAGAAAAAQAASDPVGSAATAQTNSEAYTDSKINGTTPGSISPPAIGLTQNKIIKGDGSAHGSEVFDLADIVLVLDGGGAAIASGARFNMFVDFACVIQQVTMLADQSGSVALDIQSCSYANYAPGTHPVSGDSIVNGGTAPSITTASKYQDATLTSWLTTVSAGTVLSLTATGGATSITRVTCSLKVEKI